MRIDLFIHSDSSISNKLDQILAEIKKGEAIMSVELDALTAQVKAQEAVDDSAITLIQGLAAQIASLKTDPVALQALSDELKAKSDALAAAITANTSTT